MELPNHNPEPLMRASRDCQLPLTINLGEHEHVAELREISRILDSNPRIADTVHAALTRRCRADRGRSALSAEQVLRAAVLYKMHGWSYRELAFELQFNEAYRVFCRLRLDQQPSKSALNRDVKSIDARCWEGINRTLIEFAVLQGIEDGSAVRTDSTVTETAIHHPTDSALLWDCVRKLTDLLVAAKKLVGVTFSDHRKVAKRRALAISNAKRMKQRVPLYRDLLKVTTRTIGYARRAQMALRMRKHPLAPANADRLAHFIALAERVVAQTERRVFHDESVPADEKIVSIFEEHTDVIRKGGRDTVYGHKICLSVGASNLITDCLVLEGNPCDSTLPLHMMERHAEVFGSCPEQAAFDGGFASRDNLDALKALGIRDVMFHKKVGLEIAEMVTSSWIYRKLRKFRAGVEGVISFLKRVFGADRCHWKGQAAFNAYVWSSVVSANLLILARHALG
jgi:transposase, IS5 family